MRFTNAALIAAISSIAVSENASTIPGYDAAPHYVASTIPASNNTFDFGHKYAVLNLDLINGLVSGVSSSPAGQTFIKNTASWIDFVNTQDPKPLTIFTRIYYSTYRKPELGPQCARVPFAAGGGTLGTSSDPNTQIYPAFKVNDAAGDIVLQKTRYYAGFGNELEEILSSNKIDTVILSGIRTSGVVLNTAYQLFNLNYNVYVIANNTIESPPDANSAINTAILEGIIPKLPASVITIEQAVAALKRCAPAVC
ncbi:hypothetical protein DOTSEDRAFT_173187 [Dothistroma septosporum NZE10]|uniref:Isochorismatase-like domain-containing protein n=1 Tax=Dothistroma septosporum (strain NZE10 / CBS 128990) TaxID=675120 RepID=N1PN03_DOTSN|nr:hypothetical protein DOTSEDRAFT_173187 [Dothistroma septosporum NZE10]